MVIEDVDDSSLPPDYRPSLLAWFGAGGHLMLSLRPLNEPGELLQWPRHDDSTINIVTGIIIGQLFVKRFTLSYWTVVCLSCPVCDIGVLWPNGWMDQDATWHGGRSRPRPHCVRWGPSSPHRKGHSSPSLFCPLCSCTVAHLSKC